MVGYVIRSPVEAGRSVFRFAILSQDAMIPKETLGCRR